MIRLKTTDNCTGKTISHMAVSGELSSDNIAAAFQGLLPLSNKTLKDITDETPDLLVFPDCIENTEDRIKDLPVITVDIPLGKNGNAEAAKIKTGNIAGFIGIPSDRPEGKEVHLKITPGKASLTFCCFCFPITSKRLCPGACSKPTLFTKRTT